MRSTACSERDEGATYSFPYTPSSLSLQRIVRTLQLQLLLGLRSHSGDLPENGKDDEDTDQNAGRNQDLSFHASIHDDPP